MGITVVAYNHTLSFLATEIFQFQPIVTYLRENN